nr:hypothetical protein [Nonomuraea diastatica]
MSAISSRPGRLAAGCGSRSGIAASTSRSSAFGPANAEVIGMPAGVLTQEQPQPQEKRLYPQAAQPARSERLTVGRERPHSTGVESVIHMSLG